MEMNLACGIISVIRGIQRKENAMAKLESIEILKEKIEKRVRDLEEVKCHTSVHVRLQIEFSVNELNDIIDKRIPKSMKEAEAELLSKCKFSKDIKDAPVHGDKYLIHGEANAKKD